MSAKSIWSIALAVVLGMAATACGPSNNQKQSDEPPASTMTPATQWEILVDGATVTPQADGSFLVAASPTVQGYQAGVTVPTDGAAQITLHYDITTQGGPGFIGVLKGDGSSWLNNFELPANQRSQGEAGIMVTGDQTVRIVVQTAPNAAARTTFTLHSVEYEFQ